MTDYEANLLGRSYVLCLRLTGLRHSRSPSGSSVGEPSSKRLQHRPPRPENLLGSLPSQLPSSGTSAQDVPIQSTISSRRPASNPVPSLVGPLDESAYGTTSGSYASRNSSSASSTMAVSHGAASHMPFAGYGTMVMPAQATPGFSSGGDELEFNATCEVIPERTAVPDQDDVVMAESAPAASVKTSGTRESRKHRRSRESKRSSSSRESDSNSDGHRRRSSCSHRRSSRKSFKGPISIAILEPV